MATSSKYGQVTLEQGGVPDDEPVFVVRAKDATAVELLSYYWLLCQQYGASQAQLDAIRAESQRLMAWQRAHRDEVKVPDSGPAPRLDPCP